MINVFYRNRNTIGQFMVALIFLGTFGFLFASDGFVSKSQALGCCGGGEAAVTSFAADSSGDYGSDILMDVEPTSGCCGGEDKVILSSSNSNSMPQCPTGGNGCNFPDVCNECYNTNQKCSGGSGCTSR